MPEPLYDGQPDSTRHWRSVSTVSKEATQALNALFGGSGGSSSGLPDVSPESLDLIFSNVGGGLGKFLIRVGELAFSPMTGKEIGANDIPIARRFVGGQLSWEDRGRFKSNIDEIQGMNRTFKNLTDNVNMAQIPALRAQAQRDRDDFYAENKHILAMRPVANKIVALAGSIDKQKERLYKSGLPESKIAGQLKALNEQQKNLYSSFNRRYFSIVDEG